MKNNQYVSINSTLYSELLASGGDSVVACYIMIKNIRGNNGKVFKEDKRSIYHTLKEQTNLSITTLKRYTKVMVDLEICFFDSVGNFCFLGGNKINKKYNKKKQVRVEVGTFTQTKLFSFKVRIYTMERLQKKAIDRKYKQKNIIARMSKGYFTTKQELNFLKRCEKKDKAVEDYNAKTILSNQGYSKLKHSTERSKSSGYYWKNKLVSAKLIQVERRFKFLRKGTQLDYLENRKFDRTIVFRNGKIFKELTPSFSTSIKEDKVIYKKKSYLQFNMIDFWINGDGK